MFSEDYELWTVNYELWTMNSPPSILFVMIFRCVSPGRPSRWLKSFLLPAERKSFERWNIIFWRANLSSWHYKDTKKIWNYQTFGVIFTHKINNFCNLFIISVLCNDRGGRVGRRLQLLLNNRGIWGRRRAIHSFLSCCVHCKVISK